MTLLVCALARGVPVGAAGEPQPVRTRTLEIDYRVNDSAQPLDRVELWFTLDGGTTWERHGLDDDRQPPVSFSAEREGEYGFYLVLSNAAGSGFLPQTGTEPQLTALIDFSPPVVQLHALQPLTILGRRTIQIRWTAVDACFGPRPIELFYQRPPEEQWIPISREPLANSSRFDWRLPDDLVGPLAVQVTATDRAGNQARSERLTIEAPAYSPPEFSAPDAALTSAVGEDLPADSAVPASARARQQAARLFAEAVACRARGELREAAARLRQAVRLNPQSTEAVVEMGDVLLQLGDVDRSMGAFQLALRQQPTMRAAHRGMATVYVHRKDYAGAAKHLRTILRYNPQDAEVWMNLGDIAVYCGDELQAREAYLRATEVDPGAARIIADARQRLELMQGSSRTYRTGEP
jgi:predicted negative regulator of RcsB-dependent stress response